jgi:hypothetical protein
MPSKNFGGHVHPGGGPPPAVPAQPSMALLGVQTAVPLSCCTGPTSGPPLPPAKMGHWLDRLYATPPPRFHFPAVPARPQYPSPLKGGCVGRGCLRPRCVCGEAFFYLLSVCQASALPQFGAAVSEDSRLVGCTLHLWGGGLS